MRSLLWKEWHEQSWKLGFSCIVLGALALIGLHARIISDESMIMFVCILGVGLLPILSSADLVATERSEGSLESLLALPVAPWRILIAKTAMGFLLCAGPLLVAATASILFASGREITTGNMVSVYGRSILAAISLFVWMLTLTIRLPNETRAGLLSIGLLVLWLIATGGLDHPSVPTLAFDTSPLACVFVKVNNEQTEAMVPFAPLLAIQMGIIALLWAWAAGRLAGAEEKP